MKEISVSLWEMDPKKDKLAFGMPILIYNSNIRDYTFIIYTGDGTKLGNIDNEANHYFCLEDPEQFYREGGKKE